MTTNQTWAALAITLGVFIGGAVYLGIDLAAVGRALLWVLDFVNQATSMM